MIPITIISITTPTIVPLENTHDNYHYETAGRCIVHLRYGLRRITIDVPVGFRTDGNSGWRDVHVAAWLVHDYMYRCGGWSPNNECSRKTADRVMVAVLKFERNFIYARLLKAMIRLFSWKFEQAWQYNAGQRDANILDSYSESSSL